MRRQWLLTWHDMVAARFGPAVLALGMPGGLEAVVGGLGGPRMSRPWVVLVHPLVEDQQPGLAALVAHLLEALLQLVLLFLEGLDHDGHW